MPIKTGQPCRLEAQNPATAISRDKCMIQHSCLEKSKSSRLFSLLFTHESVTDMLSRYESTNMHCRRLFSHYRQGASFLTRQDIETPKKAQSIHARNSLE